VSAIESVVSNDLTVSPLAAGPFNDSAAVRHPVAAAVEPTIQVPATNPGLAAPLITNPTLRLDAALELVVVEYRDDRGTITTSIPSQRALAAYRRWDATRTGPAPRGDSDGAAASPGQADQPAAIAPSRHDA
jgi:hypothetical protein